MELKIKTREIRHGDDFAVLFYKGSKVCRAQADYFDELCFSDLRLPVQDGYDDDEWPDFFNDVLLENFDEEQQVYIFEDYKFIILDV